MATTLDYDKYGHCIECGDNLIISQVIDGQLYQRLSAQYDETEYLLTDGSIMRVVTCKNCKNPGLDTNKIMKKVYKGWEVATDLLLKDPKKPLWTKEHRDAHLNRYKKLSIVGISEGKSKEVLERELREYKEKNKPSKDKGKK